MEFQKKSFRFETQWEHILNKAFISSGELLGAGIYKFVFAHCVGERVYLDVGYWYGIQVLRQDVTKF